MHLAKVVQHGNEETIIKKAQLELLVLRKLMKFFLVQAEQMWMLHLLKSHHTKFPLG